jgi:C1A family cysteine protease
MKRTKAVAKTRKNSRPAARRVTANAPQKDDANGTVAAPRTTKSGRKLDVHPDPLDFRDRMYEPTLVEVPPAFRLEDYQQYQVPILDQGQEGACTGFGLATVVNYLLNSFKHANYRDHVPVSARMLYDMARRYDEWPGEKYEGSSARGAMKGWHKHGVCSAKLWPYKVPPPKNDDLTAERSEDARKRLLGAYLRANHRDLVAMHSAICEAGVLYATSQVHSGWDKVKADGIIPFEDKIEGGHAFAIVAYDRTGFWIQNSWGPDWGRKGFAQISYDDWLTNGTDVWVARLGVPIVSRLDSSTAVLTSASSGNPAAYTHEELRPHIISTGNNGDLRDGGMFGSTPQSVAELFNHYIPQATTNWKKKRILFFAHGGLVSEQSAIQRVAEVRQPLLDHEVYPVAFIWRSDYLSTLQNILRDALSRRTTGGILDSAKDFMLDRADDLLEPVARTITGKAEWTEMKENAEMATTRAKGGGRQALTLLANLANNDPTVEVHLVGHSAGAVFLGPIVQLLTSKGKISAGPLKGASGLNLKIATLTLWAPACTVDFFNQYYAAALQAGAVGDFSLFTLTDKAEQDDNCAGIYHKSLLYLVSNAFERRFRIPLVHPDGEPIVGMEKFIRKDNALAKLISNTGDWILAPNTAPNVKDRSAARHHGDFDNDVVTLQATLARVLGQKSDGFSGFTHFMAPRSLRARLQGMTTSSELRMR